MNICGPIRACSSASPIRDWPAWADEDLVWFPSPSTRIHRPVNRDSPGRLLGTSGLRGNIYYHHRSKKCKHPRKDSARHLICLVVKSCARRAGISNGPSRVAAFAAGLLGGELVMKSAVAVPRSASRVHVPTARHSRCYTNIRHFGGLSSRSTGSFLSPRQKNPRSVNGVRERAVLVRNCIGADFFGAAAWMELEREMNFVGTSENFQGTQPPRAAGRLPMQRGALEVIAFDTSDELGTSRLL